MTLDELLTVFPSATKISLYKAPKKDSNFIGLYFAGELMGTLNEVVKVMPDKNQTITIIIKEGLY